MLRVLITISAFLLVFPGAAAAGGLYVDTTVPPADLHVGETWTAKLAVATCLGRAAQDVVPTLRLEQQGTGRTMTVVGRRSRSGGWIAKVRFPSAGAWSVAPGTRDGTLFAPRRVTVQAESGTAGLSRWPIAAGLLALAGAAAVAFRCRRFLS